MSNPTRPRSIPKWLLAARSANYIEDAWDILRYREAKRKQLVATHTNATKNDAKSSEAPAVFSVAVGSSRRNMGFNRYVDILPYDHTRVILKLKGQERYLNANWIRERAGSKWWVATQAPLPHTANALLSLIANPVVNDKGQAQHIRTIVQLTVDVEHGRRKANPYFPKVVGESIILPPEPGTDAHALRVQLVNQTFVREATCVHSHIRITTEDGDTTTERTEVDVQHLLFRGWPDFGVPEQTSVLLKFIRYVDQVNREAEGGIAAQSPIVIGCSAGVGRTGTFIAISSLLEAHGALRGEMSVEARGDDGAAERVSVLGDLPDELHSGIATPVPVKSHVSETTDIEGSAPSLAKAEDPFMFANGIKNPDELAEMRKRHSGKKIEKYHRNQNELIRVLLKPMEELTQDAADETEAARIPVKIAVYASLVANFVLCVLQLYAAISSLSLSLLATGIDSIFDIGSNIMLFVVNRKSSKLDVNKWPVGGSRLETIGNIVYGSLMSSVNLVVIVEALRTLVTHKNGELNDFHIPSLISVGAALGIKFLLFLYCLSLRSKSSQVHVLWEDHRNDLFINGFGLLMSAGGSRLRWWLDPMGAVIIASGVIIAWSRTIWLQFELLAGKSAPHDFLQLIIYKAMTFSEDIERLDTVRAYHSGPDYFVEIDIVMPADTPLWKAHDISQQLQDKIEILPRVERAFVHVDHETTHRPEHRKEQ
ncbi:phosphatases II [Sistotremastrum suecicum HHB10207 ss-3]|uniref:Phosphatases II n=1 Tax=Sistotremastrum suecicum HHB10207 ss-3 TaxID=1314776 RepID=A0A166ILS5_9AGAM|nr:phosphatases II [Sistotremastrum suecicum HHB10207 ss-3]